jgi:hypothetical protein
MTAVYYVTYTYDMQYPAPSVPQVHTCHAPRLTPRWPVQFQTALATLDVCSMPPEQGQRPCSYAIYLA